MRAFLPAGLLLLCLLLISAGCTDASPSSATPAPSATAVPTTTARPVTTAIPVTTTLPPDPLFSNPLHVGQQFLFGNGTKWVSDAAVTRFWINDTYRWYSPEELQYITRVAPEGKKYLFLFVSFVNYGTHRAPLPPQGNIYVVADGKTITPYAQHPLPMANPDSTPRIARIAEIEYSHKVYSSELMEDYGYSHGQKLAFIDPGESNAVEGYIIYEVPGELVPEKTYVQMVLPDGTNGVWILG